MSDNLSLYMSEVLLADSIRPSSKPWWISPTWLRRLEPVSLACLITGFHEERAREKNNAWALQTWFDYGQMLSFIKGNVQKQHFFFFFFF